MLDNRNERKTLVLHYVNLSVVQYGHCLTEQPSQISFRVFIDSVICNSHFCILQNIFKLECVVLALHLAIANLNPQAA